MGHLVRATRPGSFEWTDRDDNVVGAFEPFADHPSIVAQLSLVTNESAPNGPVSAGIYITRPDAEQIIAWLARRLEED